ncbi:MAG: hypothetical protein AMK69_20145 [Nitrospira bacterium SG8_3]|nr:MAG: hypothetical protein AMK69_20145 [Nitrospira bacterium SG8_3]
MGKQNQKDFLRLYLINRRHIEARKRAHSLQLATGSFNFGKHNKTDHYFKMLPLFFILFTIN